MARSILPCTHRKTARQAKARVSRRHRRREKQALNLVDDEAIETAVKVSSRKRRTAMTYVVMDRQGGDKINHFCRWARARTEGAKTEVDRYYRAKSLLGSDSLINEHALGHFVDREIASNPTWGNGSAWRRRRERSLPTRPFASEKHLRKLLRRAFAIAHGELNAVLKQVGVPTCDKGSPCRNVRHASECSGKLLVRVPDDLLCVARRVWTHGQRPLAEPPSLDERVATFLRDLGLLRS